MSESLHTPNEGVQLAIKILGLRRLGKLRAKEDSHGLNHRTVTDQSILGA
jgi:hypothetical protein